MGCVRIAHLHRTDRAVVDCIWLAWKGLAENFIIQAYVWKGRGLSYFVEVFMLLLLTLIPKRGKRRYGIKP